MCDSISNRLKRAMEIRNMKQSKLSQITGIGKSSISQYISGDYEPKQGNIYLLAQALDVNEAWLMGHDVKMDREIKPTSISLNERNLLKKYNSLDEKGRHTVNTILEVEYNRCINSTDEYMPETLAAHDDDIPDDAKKRNMTKAMVKFREINGK